MMKPKKMLILGGNFFPEPTGIGKYNGEMADWLIQNGFEVTVITTFPYYPQWKIQQPYKQRRYWFKKEHRMVEGATKEIKIYRCPHYVPAKPSGLKRMVSDFSIVFATFLVVFRLLFARKYDYVLTVAPPFQTGLLAILYKKIKGAKTIYHIQDLQIDAAKDLGMIKSNFLIDTLFKVEKYILKKTDHVSSISNGMINRIRMKTDADILFLPNWVETDKFFPVTDKAKIKKEFGFLPTDKIVLYSGAIGEKQGIESILIAAEAFLSRPDVKFVICGSGPYKEKLIEIRASKGLQNVVFLPLQPSDKFNAFLNMADVHLVLQKAGASDLVMPSKLSTILAVGGVAIVSASEGTGLHDYIHDNRIGILITPEHQTALNDAIHNVLLDPDDHIPSRARAFAEEHLSIHNNLSSFFEKVAGRNAVLSIGVKPVIAG